MNLFTYESVRVMNMKKIHILRISEYISKRINNENRLDWKSSFAQVIEILKKSLYLKMKSSFWKLIKSTIVLFVKFKENSTCLCKHCFNCCYVKVSSVCVPEIFNTSFEGIYSVSPRYYNFSFGHFIKCRAYQVLLVCIRTLF